MKPPTHDAWARQHAGEPPSVAGRGGERNNRSRNRDVEPEIARLAGQSKHDLWLAWRQLHRTGPPPGLSRDLLIRALVHQLQERTYGGVSRVQRRRLQTLSAEFEKGAACSDSGIMLKTGTTLLRQWRGHTHTVLVRENGFEYDGQHYRSLTVIAEKITGAHWSGPRFFGLTRRSGASVGAEAGR
jgi:hypothetical protein